MIKYLEDCFPGFQVVRNPPKWLYRGNVRLMETASGYGRKLTTDYSIKLPGENRLRRLYCCIISNNGTTYALIKKEWYILRHDNMVGAKSLD